MKTLFRFPRFAVLALALVPASCTNTTTATGLTSPTTSGVVPFSTVDLLIGDGAAAVSGQTLTVNYTGWLFDPTQPEDKGLVFDSSLTSGTPFQFDLGAGEVIQGWDQGLVGMKIGGIRRLVIPPNLGYGDTRSGAIPPDSTLVFEITLLDAEAPSTTTTTSKIHR